MAKSEGQAWQDVVQAVLARLGLGIRSTQDVVFSKIDQELDFPLRAFPSSPPDAVLNISANKIIAADGSEKSTPPQANVIPDFVATTINFQTGATTGGNVDMTLPSTAIGNFRRGGFSLIDGNTLKVIFSPEAASVGALANPGTLFVRNGIKVLWIDLEATAATAYKTAGSATNIIETSVGGQARIHRVTAAGTQIAGSNGFSFYLPNTDAPTVQFDEIFELLNFDHQSAQEIFAVLNIPADYVKGSQILLKGGLLFSAATSGNVLMKATTTLIQPGTSELGSLTDTQDSTNSEITVPGTANQAKAIGDINLTSPSGQINSINVQPFDILLIKLFRDVDNETSSATAEAKVIRQSFQPILG